MLSIHITGTWYTFSAYPAFPEDKAVNRNPGWVLWESRDLHLPRTRCVRTHVVVTFPHRQNLQAVRTRSSTRSQGAETHYSLSRLD